MQKTNAQRKAQMTGWMHHIGKLETTCEENEVLKKDRSSLHGKLSSIESEAQERARELWSTRASLQQQGKELADERQLCDKQRKELGAARDELAARQKRVDGLEAMLTEALGKVQCQSAELESERALHEAHIAKAEDELAAERERVGQLQARVEVAGEAQAELMAASEAATKAALEAQQEAERKCSEHQETIASKTAQFKEMQSQVAEAEKKCSEHQETIASKAAQLKELESQVAEARSEVEETQGRHEEEAQRLRQELLLHESRAADAEMRVEELKQQDSERRRAHEEHAQELERQVSTHQEELATAHHAKVQSLQQELEAYKEHNGHLERQCSEHKSAHEAALEAHAFVQQTLIDQQAKIEELEAHVAEAGAHAAQATARQEEVKLLQQELHEQRQLSSLNTQKLQERGQLEKQLLAAQHEVNEKTKLVLDQQQKIAQLETTLAEVWEETERQHVSHEQELSAVRDKAHHNQALVDELEQVKDQVKEYKTKLSLSVQEYKAKLSQAVAEASEHQAERQQVEEHAKDLELDVQHWRQKAQLLDQDAEEMRQRRADDLLLRQAAEEDFPRVQQLALTVRQLQADCELLEAENCSLKEVMSGFEEELDTHAQSIGHTNHKQKIRYTVQLKDEINRLLAELKRARQQIVQLEASKTNESLVEALASLGMRVELSTGAAHEPSASTAKGRCGAQASPPPRASRRASLPAGRAASASARHDRAEDAHVEELERRSALQRRALERISVDFQHLRALIERVVMVAGADNHCGGVSFAELLQRLRDVIARARRDGWLGMAGTAGTPERSQA